MTRHSRRITQGRLALVYMMNLMNFKPLLMTGMIRKMNILNEFPDARVWIEEDWFYNLEDMKKIKASYNNNWCYIDPKNI